jgi:hypothetical protein
MIAMRLKTNFGPCTMKWIIVSEVCAVGMLMALCLIYGSAVCCDRITIRRGRKG